MGDCTGVNLCERCGGVGFEAHGTDRQHCERCLGSGLEHPRIAELEARVLNLDAALAKLTADRDRDVKRAGEDVARLHVLLKKIVGSVELPRFWVQQIDEELGYDPEPDGAA